MTGFPRFDFWDFSIAIYAEEPVARACLDLQERHQIDVNLLLFCVWLGMSGRGALDATEMARVRGRIEPWHAEVVRHLRSLRVRLKGGFADAPTEPCERLRRRIAALEIDAEHLEQLMLHECLDREPDRSREPKRRRADALGSIERYWESFGAALEGPDRAAINTILDHGAVDAVGSD